MSDWPRESDAAAAWSADEFCGLIAAYAFPFTAKSANSETAAFEVLVLELTTIGEYVAVTVLATEVKALPSTVNRATQHVPERDNAVA